MSLRTALVHDFLVSVRGADRVFLEMCELWPDADVYTPVYDEEGTEGLFASRNIHTSFLQRLPGSAERYRYYLPLFPAAMRAFDFSGYDLVLSSSHAVAKAARRPRVRRARPGRSGARRPRARTGRCSSRRA